MRLSGIHRVSFDTRIALTGGPFFRYTVTFVGLAKPQPHPKTMMNISISKRPFLTRISAWSAAALLGTVVLTQTAAGEPEINTGPNTWTNGGGVPIWNLNTGIIKPPVQLPQNSTVPIGEFAANWTFGTLPTSTENVLFPSVIPTFPNAGEFGSAFSSLVNGQTILLGTINIDPNSLTFLNSYTLVAGSKFAPGSFLFQSGRVVLPITSGQITVGGGSTATIDVDLLAENGTLFKLGPGNLILNDTVTGNIQVLGGMLGGTFVSTGSLMNLGTLSPGDAPGTIRLQGNYQQGKGANLNITLASPTNFDQLIVGGKATLGGNANISLVDGFLPKRGEKFTFLYAGAGISGEFDQVNAPVWDLLTLRPIYGRDSVTVKVVIDSFDALPGLTANQHAVAGNLDTVLYDPRETKLINYLYGRDFNQLPGDFEA